MTVAVVTGASRGIGRGIALSLGDIGATVYVTGRTMRGEKPIDGAPGTVDETAELVTERGGRGIAVRCDHTNYPDIERLLAKVSEENDGKLDVLVNSAWGGYEMYDHAGFSAPFWEQDFEAKWNGMFVAGLRPTLATSHAAIPLLVRSDRALIVNIAAWDRARYLGALMYDTAKAAIVRATATMAHELRPHRVGVVAVFPGFTGTERVKMAGATGLESPEYTGRCVAALVTDPDVALRSGGGYRAGELARDYGVTDIDGSQPEPFDLPDDLILTPPPASSNSGSFPAL
jgi:NAD(P)-dependent dehydrogenase (short-subunit alcohol dehydrogenase family)